MRLVKRTVVDFFYFMVIVLIFHNISNVEAGPRKTTLECAIYFAPRQIGDVYIVQLKKVPPEVRPQHIVPRFIAPDEDGNLRVSINF